MPDKGNSGSGYVLKRLVEHIRENDLSAGARLPSISELAVMWDTGWNTVREGLIRAEGMGLVDIYPRAGSFVRTPDFSPLADALAETIDLVLTAGDRNLLHLIETRFILEIEIAGLAAGKRRMEDMLVLKESLAEMSGSRGVDSAYIAADEKFHLGIAGLTGNGVLESILNALLVLLRPCRMGLGITVESREETDELHGRIYGSLVEGDGEAARRLMRKHLEIHRDNILESLKTAGTERGKEVK